MRDEMKTNPYVERLKKFMGKKAKVTTTSGTIIEGILSKIEFSSLNCIVQQENRTLVVGNVESIESEEKEAF